MHLLQQNHIHLFLTHFKSYKIMLKKVKMLQKKIKKTLQAINKFINQTIKNFNNMKKSINKIWLIAGVALITTSCNFTRRVTTESSYFQRGDTTCTIVTKTTETYDATKH